MVSLALMFDPEQYESPRVNAVYFVAIFVALSLWSRLLGNVPDIGVLSGLIGVSGTYLFLLRTISFISETFLDRPLDDNIHVGRSILRELYVSVFLFFGSVITLFLWNFYPSPFPTLTEVSHLFIAFGVGVFVKFMLMKFMHVPLIAVGIGVVMLLVFGWVLVAVL